MRSPTKLFHRAFSNGGALIAIAASLGLLALATRAALPGDTDPPEPPPFGIQYITGLQQGELRCFNGAPTAPWLRLEPTQAVVNPPPGAWQVEVLDPHGGGWAVGYISPPCIYRGPNAPLTGHD